MIQKRREDWHVFWEEHYAMSLERFEPGKLHQVADVDGGEPVLLRARHFHTEPFSERDQRFPEMIVSRHQHARVAPTQRFQVPKRLENIDSVADIVKQNVIESLLAPEQTNEFFLVRKRDREIERRVSLFRDADDFLANVDSFCLGRLDRREQIP